MPKGILIICTLTLLVAIGMSIFSGMQLRNNKSLEHDISILKRNQCAWSFDDAGNAIYRVSDIARWKCMKDAAK